MKSQGRLFSLLGLVVVMALIVLGGGLPAVARSQPAVRAALTLGEAARAVPGPAISSPFPASGALPQEAPARDTPPDAQSTTGPTPPPGVDVVGALATSQAAVVIPDVPAYIWHHGCGPTAAGMIVGYWDTQGFDDLVPGDASTQTAAVDAMMATEGPASNYTDYCQPIDSYPTLLPDKSELPLGDEHADDCVADYMKTSQSYHYNYYGWSWFSDVGPAMENYVNALAGSDYAVTVGNLFMAGSSGLNWDSFRAEMDAGQPMVLLVDTDGSGGTDHFVTAVGYDVVGGIQKYACLNTWDTGVHWFDFAPLASGQPWGIYGAITFHIELSSVPCDADALIGAINVANSDGEADTLDLTAGCTYTLTGVDNGTDGPNGLPSITSEIILNGNGATIERSDTAPDLRIFHVGAEGHLTLNALTVSNGRASGSFAGGGILNDGGTVSLTGNSAVSGNDTAADGGGIFNGSGSTLTLIDSTVSGNTADRDGGGIFNDGGLVTLTEDSAISDNRATISGGGVKNDNGGVVKVIDSTIRDNVAATVDGGGIDNYNSTVQLIDSTVSGNSTGRDGGGIDNFEGSTVELTHSTVSSNTAEYGGGIANQGVVRLTHSTLSHNSAASGGGIHNFALRTVELTNTIVASQTLGVDCGGDPVTSNGHNLDSDGTCGLTAPGDLPDTDPLLGPLQDNGGPTETHALLPASPAIDAGRCSGFTADQRGRVRPVDNPGVDNVDDGCDIGAVERQLYLYLPLILR